jgi:hypothetical protein
MNERMDVYKCTFIDAIEDQIDQAFQCGIMGAGAHASLFFSQGHTPVTSYFSKKVLTLRKINLSSQN